MFRSLIAFCLFALALLVAAPARATMEEEEYVMRVVERLASPAIHGRRMGTFGARLAANYLADEFLRFGVRPLRGYAAPATRQDYFHYFRVSGGESAGAVGRNVIGWVPGTMSVDPAKGCFIVTAHYDHLGVTQMADGRWTYYPGANDNASGVAAVLALARRCTLLGQQLPYPTVFVFFDGEEQGLLGSKALMEDPPIPLDRAFNVNFDMVGALKGRKLLVAYAAESDEIGARAFWDELKPLAESAGLELEYMRRGWEASDQYSFYQKDVPFVFMFGGMVENWDRITDTPDVLDYSALSGVTAFTWALLDRIGSPADFRRIDLASSGESGGVRTAFLGIIPDFAVMVEHGVPVAGAVPESPAEEAGLQKGDIVLEINGVDMADLKALADILTVLIAGEKVEIVFLRGGQELRAETIAAPPRE
jgi:hypothetical protein